MVKKGGASPVGPMRGLIILTLILTIILTTHNNWHDAEKEADECQIVKEAAADAVKEVD